jgi:chromate transporter
MPPDATAPTPDAPTPHRSDAPARVPLFELFIVFLKIGTLAIGGGGQAFLYRDIVEVKKWVSDRDYVVGLAIAQVLPGANPVNLAVYFGQKLGGGMGSIAAVFGMVVPAFCIILAAGYAYRQLQHYPATHFILLGAAAVGISATLAMSFKISAKIERNLATIVLGLATFIAVGILRLPMVWVVCVTVPLSILYFYVMERRDAG